MCMTAEIFDAKCNKKMVSLEKVESNEDIAELKSMIEKHYEHTNSVRAENILSNWDPEVNKFTKVIPHDYKKVLETLKEAEIQGLDENAANLMAFERVTGKKAAAVSG